MLLWLLHWLGLCVCLVLDSRLLNTGRLLRNNRNLSLLVRSLCVDLGISGRRLCWLRQLLTGGWLRRDVIVASKGSLLSSLLRHLLIISRLRYERSWLSNSLRLLHLARDGWSNSCYGGSLGESVVSSEVEKTEWVQRSSSILSQELLEGIEEGRRLLLSTSSSKSREHPLLLSTKSLLECALLLLISIWLLSEALLLSDSLLLSLLVSLVIIAALLGSEAVLIFRKRLGEIRRSVEQLRIESISIRLFD